jgi:hypothetical protein
VQVFHGSYTKIHEIDLTKCQSNKDFGRGFYVTKFRHQAETWAEIIGSLHDTKGVVTEFTFYERAFSDDTYKTLCFSEYNEEWFDFVILNRDKSTMDLQHDYDIIEGPIADDKVQNKIDLYLNGKITKEKFFKMISHHEETHQICFCTRKSLQMIDAVSKDAMLNSIIIAEPIIENLMSDFNIDEEKAADIFYLSKTFGKLSDETTKLYQKSWQEIYEMLKIEIGNNLN